MEITPVKHGKQQFLAKEPLILFGYHPSMVALLNKRDMELMDGIILLGGQNEKQNKMISLKDKQAIVITQINYFLHPPLCQFLASTITLSQQHFFMLHFSKIRQPNSSQSIAYHFHVLVTLRFENTLNFLRNISEPINLYELNCIAFVILRLFVLLKWARAQRSHLAIQNYFEMLFFMQGIISLMFFLNFNQFLLNQSQNHLHQAFPIICPRFFISFQQTNS